MGGGEGIAVNRRILGPALQEVTVKWRVQTLRQRVPGVVYASHRKAQEHGYL